MNRDYFTRPIQGGGRDAYDYGRTSFGQPEGESWASAWIACLVVAAVIIAVVML